MQISKKFVILIIFLLAVVVIPAPGSVPGDNSNQVAGSSFTTDQLPVGPPKDSEVNASITNVDRNVTLQLDGRFELEDDITLKIYGEDTKIAFVNYTLPTAYAKHIVKIDFFSKFDDRVGLGSSSTKKPYSVFRGQKAITFIVDIRQNGTLANNTLDSVNMLVESQAFNLLKIDLFETGQRGTFPAPVIPMFQNLPVDNSLIGITTRGTVDSFDVTEIDKIDNNVGAEMPILSEDRGRITYNNMSREAYSLFSPLQTGDLDELVYRALTPADFETNPSTPVPFVISNAERILRIDPWSKVFITETIEILHLGAPRNETSQLYRNVHQVPGMNFKVSDDALITDVYDDFGRLELTSRERDDNGYPVTQADPTPGNQALRIDFRTPIYGGQTYELTVEYEYNSSNIISIDRGNYRLNTTLFSVFNTSIWNLNVRYQLPSGASIISQEFQPKSQNIEVDINTQIARKPLSTFRHLELVIQATNATQVDNFQFGIVYRYNGMDHVSYFFTFLITLVLLLGLVYALTNIQVASSKAVEIERQQLPIKEMENFFNVFSEKAGAEKRLTELRERRRKGKISKKDYDGKVKAIRRRLREITPQLEQSAKELSEKGGRYDNYVNKVMLSSQRQTDTRRNARSTKRRYERGEITKKVYQNLMKEYSRNLSKQEETINKTLAEMVELIQKYNQ